MAKPRKLIGFAKTEIDRHLCFWVMFVVAVLAFVLVPQVAHTWREAKPEGMSPWMYGGFVLFVGVVIVFYVVSMFTVLRPFPFRIGQIPLRRWWRRRRRTGGGWRFLYWCWRIPELACLPLLAIRRRLWNGAHGTRNARTAALSVPVAVAMLAFGAPGDSSRSYVLAGVLCGSLGILVLACGLWLALPSCRRGTRRIGPATGRMLGWILTTSLIGEVLWLMACGGVLEFSFRLYSIWAICHVFTFVVLAALFVDRLHATWVFPIRPVAIFAVAIAILWIAGPATLRSDEADHFRTDEQRLALADETRDVRGSVDWRGQLLSRIEEIEGGPVVFVAASGGGSRAAIFTALVLEALARTPLDDSPIGSTQPAGRTFGDNIALISGVSGGSLAAAYYLAERARGRELETVDELESTTRSELEYLCRERLLSQLGTLHEGDVDAGSAPVPDLEWPPTSSQLLAYRNAWRGRLEEARAALRAIELREGEWRLASPRAREEARAGHQAAMDEADARVAMIDAVVWLDSDGLHPEFAEDPACDELEWTLRSAAFDAMCTDFMAPLLRGLVSVTLTRGDALARFWTELFEWHGVSDVRGYPVGSGWSYPVRVPLAIYNATDVTRGRRLTIGFPPLPSEFGTSDDATGRESISLHGMAPDLELTLARAVRLSSNFPWGFRVQELAEQDGRRAIRILDGGVVDNTGLDTIHHVLRALEDEARAAPRSDGEVSPAQRILDGLRSRSVLLLEIDSGAKPEETLTAAWKASLLDPVQALGNATHAQAERARQHHIEEIQRIVRGSIAERVATTFQAGGVRPTNFHVVLQCNHYDAEDASRPADVMTAWSLGPRDKAEVLSRFLVQLSVWDHSRQVILEALSGDSSDGARLQERIDERVDKHRAVEKRAAGAVEASHQGSR